jgi:hypothetical protein
MSDIRYFADRIRRFSRARRGLLNTALSCRLGTWALLAGILALLLLCGWLPGAVINLGLFALLALFVLALLAVVLLRWQRFRSHLDEAFRMELLAGNLQSRVVSAWDFLERDLKTPLTQHVIEQAHQDLQQEHERRLERRERNQRLQLFLLSLTAFVALGLTPWFSFAQAAGTLHHSWLSLQDWLFPVGYTLAPGPGTHIQRLRQPVPVSIRLQRSVYSEVGLLTESNGQEQTEPIAVGPDGQASREISSDVEAELTVRFRLGSRTTEPMHFIFTSPPVLENMQTELFYPSYTRLLPRSLEGVQQRLLGLPGTRITLGFTCSKELREAALLFDDGQVLPLDIVGRFATVSLLHQRERTATLQVRDIHGLELEAPLEIRFEVQIDEKPVLLLPRHLKEDMPMLEEAVKLFSFGVQAQDDYGLTRLILKWQKSTVDNPNSIQDKGEIERVISPVQPRVLLNYEKVFAALNLRPGDRLSFQVEAHDNRAPERQVTVSRRCSLFIYQEGLGGLSIKELGFGAGADLMRERIPRATRATTVKAPEGLRTGEKVRNEFEGEISTGTRTPSVRGEYGKATQDYFRLLSTVKYPEARPGQPEQPPREP